MENRERGKGQAPAFQVLDVGAEAPNPLPLPMRLLQEVKSNGVGARPYVGQDKYRRYIYEVSVHKFFVIGGLPQVPPPQLASRALLKEEVLNDGASTLESSETQDWLLLIPRKTSPRLCGLACSPPHFFSGLSLGGYSALGLTSPHLSRAASTSSAIRPVPTSSLSCFHQIRLGRLFDKHPVKIPMKITRINRNGVYKLFRAFPAVVRSAKSLARRHVFLRCPRPAPATPSL
jgi:hypothetical protein